MSIKVSVVSFEDFNDDEFNGCVGRVFNRLTVINEDSPHVNPKTGVKSKRVFCLCTCGNTKTVYWANLITGKTQSCGCLHKQKTSQANKTHGETNTRFYKIWAGINKRCKNPKAINYANYGGRGIIVCERWDSQNDLAFQNFKEDMFEGYSDSLTIDRIDVMGIIVKKTVSGLHTLNKLETKGKLLPVNLVFWE